MLRTFLFSTILLCAQFRISLVCPEGCLSCASPFQCTLCDLQALYYPKNGLCAKSNTKKCLKINSVGQCTQCEENHYVFRSSLCLPVLPIEYCQQYDSRASETICLACQSPKILAENRCLSPINFCTSYDPETGFCVECQIKYKLSATWKQCLVGLIRNCDFYDRVGYCSKCNEAAPRISLRKEACLPVIQNCALHSSMQNLCLECQVGFLKASNNKKCLKEITGCEIYASSSATSTQMNCQQCRPNCLRIESELGVQCKSQLVNCRNFDPETQTCLFCKSGFRPTNDAKICLPVIPNCDKYQPSTFKIGQLACIICAKGFHLAGPSPNISTFCLQDIQNCDKHDLTDPTKCYICAINYIPAEDGLSCRLSIPNCLALIPTSVATNQPKCQKCLGGFTPSFDSLTCLRDIIDCIKHVGDGLTCQQCLGDKRATDDRLACLPEIANCAVYSISSFSSPFLACDKCKEFYMTFDRNTKCVDAISNCLELAPEDFTKCKICQSEYKPTDDRRICLKPIDNCQKYSPSNLESATFHCTECKAGFELINNQTICLGHIKGCLEQDLGPSFLCRTCAEGLNLTDDLLNCLPKIQNCAAYQSSSHKSLHLSCRFCDSDFEVLDNGKSCITKIPNCSKRDSSESRCEECDPGYWLDHSTKHCHLKIKNCSEHFAPTSISGEVQCKQCLENFELHLDNRFCVPIINNCQTRNKMSFLCTQCNQNYTPSGDGLECLKSIANCQEMVLVANQTKDFKCLQCKSNYQLYADGTLCTETIPNCETQNPISPACLKCADGFLPTTNGLACLASIENCTVYAESSQLNENHICLKCSDGFELIENLRICVQKVEECLTLDLATHFCASCTFPLVLTDDNFKCLQPINNCFQYLPSSKTDTFLRCEVCQKDLIAIGNGDLCAPKIDKCEVRDAEFRCVKCSLGFHPTSDGLKCLSAVTNCETYAKTTYDQFTLKCAQCHFPFILRDNSCSELLPISNCQKRDDVTGRCFECTQGFSQTSDFLLCLQEINSCRVYAQSTKLSKSLSCLLCEKGKVPTTDGTICLPEIPNCALYAPSSVSTKVLTCKSCLTYFELENGLCIRNGLQNCLLYNKSTETCNACETGFLQTNDSKLCLPDIFFFCIVFNPSNKASNFLTCNTCLPGFVLADDHRCCSPPIRFCLKYFPSDVTSKSLSCQQCEPLYLAKSDGTCQRKVIKNCKLLSLDTGKCTQCFPASVLTTDGEQCLPEVYQCLNYAPSDFSTKSMVCQKCNENATLTKDNLCYDGTIAYCTKYGLDMNICMACDRGKVVTSDARKCLDPVLDCQIYKASSSASSDLQCQTCANGYQQFNDDKICGLKVTLCQAYDPVSYFCTECAGGYQLTTDRSNCLSAIDNCLVYDYSSSLTSVLICLQCAKAFMPGPGGRTCLAKVIQNCQAINPETGLCIKCASGYRLTDDRELCLPDFPNCRVYQESNRFSSLFQCLQCRPGYQLIALFCLLKPIAFCEIRNPETTSCQTCISGRRPTDDGEICLEEIENCSEYSPSSKSTETFVCLKCKAGTFPLNGNCVTFIANCSSYDQRYFFCTECQQGFEVTSDGEKCLKAIENCDFYAFSTAESSQLTCLFCKSNYNLADNGAKCSQQNPPPKPNGSFTMAVILSSSPKFTVMPALICPADWSLTDDNKKCLPKIEDCAIYELSSVKTIRKVCLKCADGFGLTLTGDVCTTANNK